MMKKLWFLLFCMSQNSTNLIAFTIDTTPLCSIYTPNSILEHKENYLPLYVGTKLRYATCTGASWFHENYLAVLNLYGKKINTYKFLPEQQNFELLQEINETQGAQLEVSENLTVSPDGSLLALCSCPPDAGVKLYRINVETHLIDSKPIFTLKKDLLVHNVRFTPDGKYLALTWWDNNTAVSIYKIVRNAQDISLEFVSYKANTISHLATKGINFTKDGKFAVVVYSAQIGGRLDHVKSGLISVYTFNADNGSLGDLVCSMDKGYPEFCCEDVSFIDNDNAIIASDQHNSMLTIYPFNPVTGQIGSDFTHIHGPETKLDFPHGIGIKQDGKYMVVTNYGSDTFNLYRLQ